MSADDLDNSAAPADSGAVDQDALAAAWGQSAAISDPDGVAAAWSEMIDHVERQPFTDPSAERLLPQSEIDSIMGFTRGDDGPSRIAGVRSIVDAGIVSYERLPMLEIVFDRLVRLLTSSLRTFFSDNVEVSLEAITSVRFGDYVNTIPLPAVLGVVRATPWDNLGIITVHPSLVYCIVDVLLGGRRAPGVARIDGRPYTTIEIGLTRRVIDIALADMEAAFRPITEVQFEVDRIETNPRFATVTRAANAAILVSLRVDLDGRGGSLELLIPYATIEPIRELLLQSFMGEKLGRDSIWEGHLATEIWQAEVEIDAVLCETEMSLKTLLAMKVGDTLTFDQKPEGGVTLRCGDFKLTRARMGRRDGRVAVQVVRPLRRSKTTLAVLETGLGGLAEGSS